MNTDDPPFDPVEQAALLVAGALPPDEVASLEARLASGDVFLASEIESYDAVIRAERECDGGHAWPVHKTIAARSHFQARA